MGTRANSAPGMRSCIEVLESRRLLAGVALDPSFANSTGGRAVIDTATAADLRSESVRSILLQPDGKIILAGASSGSVGSAGLIVRLNADGTQDQTFATGGIDYLRYDERTTVTTARLLPNGKILIAGNGTTTGGFVTRLNADGSIDTTFGTSGSIHVVGIAGQLNVVQDLIVLSDGKLLVSGTALLPFGSSYEGYAAIARYNANGSIDTAFGSNGRVLRNQNTTTQGLFGLVQLSPSKVMAITSYGQFTLIDPIAGTISAPITTTNNSVAGVRPEQLIALPDGRFVAMGSYNTPGDVYAPQVIARYNGDGTLDTSFGTGGYTTLTAFDTRTTISFGPFVRLADGSLTIAVSTTQLGRSTSFGLTRVTAEGVVDNDFANMFSDGLRVPAGTYGLSVSNAVLDAQGRLITTAGSTYGPVADNVNSTTNIIVSRYVLDARITPHLMLPAAALTQGDSFGASAAGTIAAGLPIVRYEWDQDYVSGGNFDVDATGPDVALKAIRSPTQTVAMRAVMSDGAGPIFVVSLPVTNAPPKVVAGAAASGAVYQPIPLAFSVADHPSGDNYTLKVTAEGTTRTYNGWFPSIPVTAYFTYPGDTSATVTLIDAGGLSSSVNLPVHVTPLTGRVVDSQSPPLGVPGATLFIDANRSGILDSGELTFGTDAGGNYTLPALYYGSYQIGVVPPGGYSFAGTTADLQFALNYQGNSTWTGGIIRLSQSAAVSGTLYDDQNGDGLADSSNTPIVGATIWADLNNNAAVDVNEPSVVTDATGKYVLELGAGGDYRIRTLAAPGLDITAASNASVTLTAAQRVMLGLVARKKPATGSLSVAAYLDANGNGAMDGGEGYIGSLNAQYAYVDFPGIAPTAFKTSGGGSTIIRSLTGSTVTASLTLPAGYSLSTIAGTTSQTVALIAGQTTTVAFGLKYTPGFGIITGRVFEDSNLNGSYDSIEPYRTSTVYVDLNDDGAFDAGEPSRQLINGILAYEIVGVPPGTQKVRVIETGTYVYPGNATGRSVTVVANQKTIGIDLGMVNTKVVPLASSIMGATQVAQGQVITLSGFGQDDLGTSVAGFEWDFDYVPGSTFTPDKTGYTISYGGDLPKGPHLIAGRAYNTNGRRNDIALFTITVVNVPPTATFASGAAVSLGSISSVTFTNATDSSSADTAAGFLYSVDFNNDGDFADPGDLADAISPVAAYTFNAPGTYTVRGRISDQDGGYTDYQTEIVVTPPAWLNASSDAVYTLSGSVLSVTAGVITLLSDVKAVDPNLVLNVSGTGGVVINSSQHLSALTLTDNAVATLSPGGGKLLRAAAIAMGTGTRLDLNDNALIFDYAGTAAQASAVGGLISSARAGGNWAGPGLTSTTARTSADSHTTLGYMEASEYMSVYGNDFTFAGEAIDNTAVLVKYTTYGDADFNGKTDFNDFLNLQNAIGHGNTTFFGGDFDYNGTTDFNDFLVLQNSFGASLPVTAAVIKPPVVAATASINGVAFNDSNRNGRYDRGDSLLTGKTIWLDLDNDGVREASEPSAVTDAKGRYAFKNLAAGRYRVRQMLRAGTVESTPARFIALANGQAAAGVLLGRRLK